MQHGNSTIEDIAAALRRYADRQAGEGPYITAIEGVIILRSFCAKPPSHSILKPALCVVAQGAKWTSFGDKRFQYHAGQALVVSVEMPSVGRVIEASPDAPFLGVIIEFDSAIMRSVIEEADIFPDKCDRAHCGAAVVDLNGALADSVLRLIRLLDTPRAWSTLAPMIRREICYWLLDGPHGADIAQVVLGSNHSMSIINAIQNLRERFCETVSIAELAAIARLGPSAFHRRFKELTSLTPLQYQKQLRLLEARRLMVSEGANVETAAFAVGYESPSQFSREYSRMFGMAPKRDSVKTKHLVTIT
ncbi:AraC family transcriptional regulator N-terminal domain-containing protein [Rhizobium johnstonii]|uniref:AraC family transcriptional regulator n=1 Tax=Rhizobium TaxID=379 RepID=UPI001031CC95|nr:AraC family transcriptional regulator [Rhizobium leguminosarum]TBH46062.1 AraC family transcriptional regulator [Rhizobium leguminosarum]